MNRLIHFARRALHRLALVGALAGLPGCTVPTAGPPPDCTRPQAPLSVQGAQIQDRHGCPVRWHGVNWFGAESAEFVVGGLTPARLRTIACRVLAVHAMSEGAKFVEVYHLLADEHDLPPRTSFMTALRAFRGGGLTKDAIYLRGLRELLEYLRNGHSVEPLYAGKIALEHVPLIQELRRRGIVGPPEQLPRFWDDAATAPRLEMCRQYSLLELVERLP